MCPAFLYLWKTEFICLVSQVPKIFFCRLLSAVLTGPALSQNVFSLAKFAQLVSLI